MSITQADLDGRIGAYVRDLRVARNLTLDGLAALADVSRAMLSRIERGESSPTAQLLSKIAAGLGITLATLFAGTERPLSPVSRRSDQATWCDPASGYRRRNVSPAGTGSPVEITEIEFPPGGTVAFDNQHAVGVDQHVWMLDGSLELTTGEQRFRLETGDCLMTRLSQPTVFRNRGARAARYAVVVCRQGVRP